MPVSVNFNSSTSYTIPQDVFSMRVQMWGGGGGGEFVSSNTFSSTDGGDGGASSWIGMVSGGGQGGGGAGGKNSLGNGGAPNVNGYPNASSFTGAIGSLYTGGTGVSSRGNGGNGTPGFATYISSSTHFFDNDANRHTFQTTSSDISLNYMNKDALDGLFGFAPTNGKYYQLTFNVPYVDNNWNWEVYGICQNAAGGGSASPYTLNGSRNKDNTGIDLWFQNNSGANGYIRCFSFRSTGLKVGAQGRGGGAGGYIDVTVSRQSLIDKGYTPGATYTVTVGGGGSAGGNTATAGSGGYVSLFMYIIPVVVLSASRIEITSGDCVDLAWSTTGDADFITWTSGNINNSNLTSSTTVCPVESTTYTAVASGRGGSSSPASVTIIVYSPPTASISTPQSLNYGDQGLISFETEFANLSITITPFYKYKNLQTDSFEIVSGDVINITPASSAVQGNPGTIVSNSALPTSIPYGETGPYSVQYVLVADGSGGQVTVTSTTEIIIDITPDNLIVPETDGRFKSENPVFAPQTEILSQLLFVDGVDVPIEIKSSSPIQVDINQQNDWKDLREI
jgi:hypothetical protein